MHVRRLVETAFEVLARSAAAGRVLLLTRGVALAGWVSVGGILAGRLRRRDRLRRGRTGRRIGGPRLPQIDTTGQYQQGDEDSQRGVTNLVTIARRIPQPSANEVIRPADHTIVHR